MENLWSKFSLEREIGFGSMSQVFRGYDATLGLPVAVKILRDPQNDRHRRIFLQEGNITSDLSHPSIARTYGVGEGLLEGQRVPYVVMEYITGTSLQSLINERGSLSGREVTSIGADIASALSYAHSRDVAHREVKPSNILITPEKVAVLLDFTAERWPPISAVIEQAKELPQARELSPGVGILRYASPEQLRQGRVGPVSDVYSLGATLYRLAAGRAPFGGDPLQMVHKHLAQPPVPLKKLAQVSDRLNYAIMRSLEKKPHLRPSASELTAILIYDLLQRHFRRLWHGTFNCPGPTK